MVLVQRLEGRQTQAPVMTAQMQASVRLLQLTNEELQAALDLYVQENPLLELKDSHRNQEAPPESVAPQVDEDPMLSMWSSTASTAGSSEVGRDLQSLEWVAEKEESLMAFLEKQAEQTFNDQEERFLALQMINLLDDWGYFNHCLRELGRQWLVPPSQLEEILAALKAFEPVGIFSESLEECLMVQLEDLGIYGPLHKKLLPHLSDLFGKESRRLRQRLYLDEETLKKFVRDIRRCYPKPSQGWEDIDRSVLKSPDVIVFKSTEGHLRIRLNDENLPRLLVNRSYVEELTDTLKATPDKTASKYFREKMSEANWLRKCLNQRAETVLNVTKEILKHQMAFFEQGVKGLKPLLLKDIASILEVHESTVSRAIAGKTVETPRGIISLKAFFTTGVTNYQQEQTSSAAIQQSIKELIDQEEPDHPYSDAQLIDLLAVKGIRLARRTVAKYRDILKIPTSYDRKHQKNRGF